MVPKKLRRHAPPQAHSACNTHVVRSGRRRNSVMKGCLPPLTSLTSISRALQHRLSPWPFADRSGFHWKLGTQPLLEVIQAIIGRLERLITVFGRKRTQKGLR
jgi:hypothetical protein